MRYHDLLAGLRQKEGWPMIVIDGVVGVGKSTLMELMAAKGYTPFPEPVVDNPILDKFYGDRERYSFPLQVFFLNRRFSHIQAASRLDRAVMDRSIYGDVIFAKMLAEAGEMSPEEFSIYQEVFQNLIAHCAPPKLMVYLEISVDEAMRRIRRRGRDFEQAVERDYWERLNANYREYFSQYDVSPLLKVNVDKLDFAGNPEHQAYILDLIASEAAQLERKAG